jgi:hypothetical protein
VPATLAAIDTSVNSLCRAEIETNLAWLRALRELQATGLGVLVVLVSSNFASMSCEASSFTDLVKSFR